MEKKSKKLRTAVAVKTVPTKAFSDQKPGTSGLRKRTKVFEEDDGRYLKNFLQAIFNAVSCDGQTLVVGGDGRYFSTEAIDVIIKMSAANGVGKLVIGRNGLLSTPAVSALIRKLKAFGGIILTASHNPGGPDADFGVKYNVCTGGPAAEKITKAIFECSKTITSFRIATNVPQVSLDTTKLETMPGGMRVEIVNGEEVYTELMKSIFDFDAIRSLLKRKDFSFVYDAMSGVAGPYAKKIFETELGVSSSQLRRCRPLPDFGKCHPDPNLTYAPELVKVMGLKRDGNPIDGAAATPTFGAAADGDADRNMILGAKFFVTPSDSVAVIADYAQRAIPYFRKNGLRALARSMPTSMALDRVARRLKIPLFEVPTGWKFFGNLMDSASLGKANYCPLICGEESFGTGSSHIREKDGVWAVLCWLSILAYRNKDDGKSLVSVRDIVVDHWTTYGRNVYCRYDYEGVEKKCAITLTSRLTSFIQKWKREGGKPHRLSSSVTISSCDVFEYKDPVDASVASNQGWRFVLSDGSRFVFRLSGTGSVGATIRLYLERYLEPDDESLLTSVQLALEPIVHAALAFSKMKELTGRSEPTVIT